MMRTVIRKKETKKEARKLHRTGLATQRQPEASTEEILTLQRAAGNRAVSQLLQRSKDSSPPTVDSVLPITLKGRDSGATGAGDPRVIQSQLGSGRPLDGSMRSRMQSAFGQDFSQVRVHTDAKASELANRLNARAFTVGPDIGFGTGEYKPGTLIGDAIVAHELAHVVQQQRASTTVAPLEAVGAESNALETDADRSALGAVTALWGRTKDALDGIAHNAYPRLRSGLRMQRCTKTEKKQAEAAFKAVVTGLASGRRQPVPIPFPDPDAARGLLQLQYGLCREDFIMWQAGLGHSPKWEAFYGTNYIDWSAYRRYGDNFGQIWPHFLKDAWNNSIPRERQRKTGKPSNEGGTSP